MARKEKVFLISFTALLLISSALALGIIQKPTQTTISDRNAPTPTPVALNPTPPTRSNPPLTYDTTAVKKLIASLEQRRRLSDADTAARRALLSPLNGESGILYSSPRIILAYLPSPDLFQGEITTTNITQAEEEAASWL